MRYEDIIEKGGPGRHLILLCSQTSSQCHEIDAFKDGIFEMVLPINICSLDSEFTFILTYYAYIIYIYLLSNHEPDKSVGLSTGTMILY